VGLRPEEKLHEELIYRDEVRVETAHPRVFRIASPTSSSALAKRLEESIRAFTAGALDRQAFTARLVDAAAGLVTEAQNAQNAGDRGDWEVFGRGDVLVSEETARS
jgi:FlaA1/EpsC-like NDP-sugar epimerase